MSWKDRLKVFYDSEFTGLSQRTTPISMGFRSEAGSYFYAEFTDYDKEQLSSWIIENAIDEHVIENLTLHDKPENSDIMTNIDGTEYIETIAHPGPYNRMVKGSKDYVKERLLEWLEHESRCSMKKIAIYSDCYAYDWLVFNSVICEDGDALKVPEYIDYIPIDLSTALMLADVDPDIEREKYIGPEKVSELMDKVPFDKFEDKDHEIKHNSLWDAYVCEACFKKLAQPKLPKSLQDDIMDEEIPE